jgi:tubulin monoglycylase TTLL3/8
MNNIEITRKSGLANNLRKLNFKNIEVDNFFPRCFELSDKMDFDDFVEDFKESYTISLLKQYVSGTYISEKILKTALCVLEKKILCWTSSYNFLKGFDEGESLKSNKFIISEKEWTILSKFEDEKKTVIEIILNEELRNKIEVLLNKLKRIQPQYYLNGPGNIWIMKPSGLSRGRGIKCMSNLDDIFKFIKRNSNLYLAQKYIENPLLILGRKVNTNNLSLT